MYSKQKLHKATLITNAVNRFLKVIGSFSIYILVIFFQEPDLMSLLTFSGMFFAIFLIIYTIDVANYFRTSYWIDGNRFVMQSGLIVRKEKDIQINRIQSIDTSEDIFHRLLKVMKITIKTPGKGITLDAVSKSEYESLSQHLNQLKENLTPHPIHAESEKELLGETEVLEADWPLESTDIKKNIYQLSIFDIFKMTLMDGVFFKGIVPFFIVFELVSDALPYNTIFSQAETLMVSTSILVLFLFLFLIILFIYTVGIILSVVRNYGFNVQLSDEYLIINKGLLETKSQTIKLKNVQSLQEDQNWVQRLFGYTSFSAGITSDFLEELNENEVIEDGRVILFPFIKESDVKELVSTCFPSYQIEDAQIFAPKKSFRWFIQFPALFWISAAIVTSMTVWSLAWVISLGILVLYIFFGYQSSRLTGFTIKNDEITAQRVSFFSVHRIYIKKDRILNLQIKQTPFLKRKQLSKLSLFSAFSAAFKRIDLNFIEEEDSFILFDWFKTERGN